jgi:hypothetical protein
MAAVPILAGSGCRPVWIKNETRDVLRDKNTKKKKR